MNRTEMLQKSKDTYERLKFLTRYFRELSSTANIELIKDGIRIIGYIAFQTMTRKEVEELLEQNSEYGFRLPPQSEFLYLEAIEILAPYQDQGYGTKALKDFKKRNDKVIIYQFTDDSEYFWEKFKSHRMIEGADWWAYAAPKRKKLAS